MSVIMTSPPHLTDASTRSVTPATGDLPVDVVVMTRVFLVICLCVAQFGEDVLAVHFVVILMVVRDETPYA